MLLRQIVDEVSRTGTIRQRLDGRTATQRTSFENESSPITSLFVLVASSVWQDQWLALVQIAWTPAKRSKGHGAESGEASDEGDRQDSRALQYTVTANRSCALFPKPSPCEVVQSQGCPGELLAAGPKWSPPRGQGDAPTPCSLVAGRLHGAPSPHSASVSARVGHA